ncbi:MAG: C39 family peptidase [Anaerolineales bacterium]|nr:C39 family peptidase [Anaerolineales bacterium]
MKQVYFSLLGVAAGLVFWLLFVALGRSGLLARTLAQVSTATIAQSPTDTPPPPLAATPAPTTTTPFQPNTFTPTASITPSSTPTATFTETPLPTLTPSIPNAAAISGISGRWPALSLDCEARSAVDWAAYFGTPIDELAFFNGLPLSDNPNKGFVGNVYAPWGQVPPSDYGVHASPVAQLLRAYGLKADAITGLSWDALRSEIAAGQPVIVWIIGRVALGTPVAYTSADGAQTIVARFEHTVIVIGYDETRVTVLDGDWVYQRSVKDFLDSWAVLGNMAVIWDE